MFNVVFTLVFIHIFLHFKLQIKSHRKSRVYIDSVDKSISNWLRYVNCARDTMEMNLEAFQYKKDVYYITLREIER